MMAFAAAVPFGWPRQQRDHDHPRQHTRTRPSSLIPSFTPPLTGLTVEATPNMRGGGREVAAYQDTAGLGFLETPRVDEAEWADTSDGQSAGDVIAERRDVAADERDREAD